jgi:hypothetical protein
LSINFIKRGVIFINEPGSSPSFNITKLHDTVAEKELLITGLQNVIGEIKTLRGILPICGHCKKIRDDRGYWNQLETYISEHSEADLSHTICPECLKEHYPGLTFDS